ncbi:hypothetical protein V2J09_002520 [Rumex salicifolius]
MEVKRSGGRKCGKRARRCGYRKELVHKARLLLPTLFLTISSVNQLDVCLHLSLISALRNMNWNDWRSNICANTKEILTPATANGYSHSALDPSVLWSNLWNDACTEEYQIQRATVYKIVIYGKNLRREKTNRILVSKINEILKRDEATTPRLQRYLKSVDGSVPCQPISFHSSDLRVWLVKEDEKSRPIIDPEPTRLAT